VQNPRIYALFSENLAGHPRTDAEKEDVSGETRARMVTPLRRQRTGGCQFTSQNGRPVRYDACYRITMIICLNFNSPDNSSDKGSPEIGSASGVYWARAQRQTHLSVSTTF